MELYEPVVAQQEELIMDFYIKHRKDVKEHQKDAGKHHQK